MQEGIIVDQTEGLFDQTDPKENLNEFQKYDASYIEKKINSTSENSEKKWVRKASFLQLSYVLFDYRLDYEKELSTEQIEAIDEFTNFVFSDSFREKPMTTREDIQKAIDVLEILGFDISKQREELKTWK